MAPGTSSVRTGDVIRFTATVKDKAGKTIEGLTPAGGLNPVQRAFVEHGATQCGFCTPGFVVSACALLKENPAPSRAEIERAISGNLCRCTGYAKIVEAIAAASSGGP